MKHAVEGRLWEAIAEGYHTGWSPSYHVHYNALMVRNE